MASASTSGCSAGATGSGMIAPKADTMANGKAAPSAAPSKVAISATTTISPQ